MLRSRMWRNAMKTSSRADNAAAGPAANGAAGKPNRTVAQGLETRVGEAEELRLNRVRRGVADGAVIGASSRETGYRKILDRAREVGDRAAIGARVNLRKGGVAESVLSNMARSSSRGGLSSAMSWRPGDFASARFVRPWAGNIAAGHLVSTCPRHTGRSRSGLPISGSTILIVRRSVRSG